MEPVQGQAKGLQRTLSDPFLGSLALNHQAQDSFTKKVPGKPCWSFKTQAPITVKQCGDSTLNASKAFCGSWRLLFGFISFSPLCL
jgi:hypothetical protein